MVWSEVVLVAPHDIWTNENINVDNSYIHYTDSSRLSAGVPAVSRINLDIS